REVRDVEPEPDDELVGEVPPATRKHPASQSDDPLHNHHFNQWGYRRATKGSLAADVRHLDLGQRSRFCGSQLRIAVGPARPDRAEALGEVSVGRTETQ